MLKSAFCFILKALFFLRYLNFCSDFFSHVEKRPDKKAKVSFTIHAVINWQTNNYNTHIAQGLKK